MAPPLLILRDIHLTFGGTPLLEGAELSPAIYTVFGQVDDAGLQIAEDIAAEGNGPDGVAPAEDVVIESIG